MNTLEIFDILKKMGFDVPLKQSFDLDKLKELSNKIYNDFKNKDIDLLNGNVNAQKDFTGLHEIINKSLNEFNESVSLDDD